MYYKHDLKQIFRVKGQPSKWLYSHIIGLWIVIYLLAWFQMSTMLPAVPSPLAVGYTIISLISNGTLIANVNATIDVMLAGISYAVLTSILISYCSVFPLLSPINKVTRLMRYLPSTGFSIVLLYFFTIGWPLKAAMLTIGLGFFLTESITQAIEAVPETDYELARVQGYSEWQVFLTVVVAGTRHLVIDAIKANIAIAFVIICFVELSNRQDGGIGAQIEGYRMTNRLDGVWAYLSVIALLAFFIDLFLRFLKYVLCPYTRVKERG